MAFKILSDFDGVWTDQAIEAETVKLFLAAEASRLAGITANKTLAHFREFEARAQAAPHLYGWAPDGRITAYVDEDPFCVANAVALFIERSESQLEKRYKEAILDGGFANLTAFADHCFLTSTASYRQEHPPALVPGARELLEGLHDAGAEVVVVSNSSAEKIIGWFRQVGVDAGEKEGHVLRVRGQAGKQTIGPSDASIEVGGRCIFVDRPKYVRAIEEENPDLIIGDVFSLDLALPHVMRAAKNPAAPATLCLRRHDHTPDWILADHAEGAIDIVVDSVSELAELARG